MARQKEREGGANLRSIESRLFDRDILGFGTAN
jgi:hypothetical protein